MDGKDKFDACMMQANYGADRHDHRRDIEWKVTLGFWALIAAAAIYLDKWSHGLRGWTLIIIYLVAFFTYARLWLYHLWKANAYDQALAKHFRQQAAKLFLDPKDEVLDLDFSLINVSFRSFLKDWSMRFQLVGTVAFLAFLVFVAWPR